MNQTIQHTPLGRPGWKLIEFSRTPADEGQRFVTEHFVYGYENEHGELSERHEIGYRVEGDSHVSFNRSFQ